MSDNEKPTTDHGPADTRPGPVEDHLGDEPPHHGMSAGQYIASRFSSLKPPMSKLPNPFSLLRMLNGHHWAFFLVAFFAWGLYSTNENDYGGYSDRADIEA
ncbi:Carboxylic acid transporter [Diaporthe eres]|uniref:Carboxylic acid transporter n=1 Tax=Diaporthe eres TaxID=83184 RepID=A0ABR1NRI9_DIAER